MPIRLNERLAGQYMTEELRSAVREAEVNSRQIVRDAIDNFRKELAERARKYEEGDYVVQFEGAAEEIQKNLEVEMASTRNRLIKVSTAIAELETAINNTQDPNNSLRVAKDNLDTSVDALKKKMEDFEKQLTTFGNKAGRFIVSQVTKGILG